MLSKRNASITALTLTVLAPVIITVFPGFLHLFLVSPWSLILFTPLLLIAVNRVYDEGPLPKKIVNLELIFFLVWLLLIIDVLMFGISFTHGTTATLPNILYVLFGVRADPASQVVFFFTLLALAGLCVLLLLIQGVIDERRKHKKSSKTSQTGLK
jgi:hypothetical protein